MASYGALLSLDKKDYLDNLFVSRSFNSLRKFSYFRKRTNDTIKIKQQNVKDIIIIVLNIVEN